MFAKPDRTSARTVKYLNEDTGALSQKQLKLAKFAYDRGYFDTPKRIRIAELAQELGLARATISEHMARIESAIMDDMFSSFSDIYVAPETLKEILQMVVDDAEELTDINNDGFSGLMLEIRSSIEEEMATLDLQRDVSDVDLEALIEESIAQHQGNISFIDDKLANRNQQLNQL
jgi:DNA-binding MurR/RpiR family transcriptional regulator